MSKSPEHKKYGISSVVNYDVASMSFLPTKTEFLT